NTRFSRDWSSDVCSSDLQWMSMFKIRGSYGELGNQSVSNYGYIPAMSTYELGYLIDGKKPLSIYSPALVSDNYTWEKVNTSNIEIVRASCREIVYISLY